MTQEGSKKEARRRERCRAFSLFPLSINVQRMYDVHVEHLLKNNHFLNKYMLWTIFFILFILWLLGLITSYTFGGFIHILLVLAIIVLIIRLFRGR
jgi:hypothetical protein